MPSVYTIEGTTGRRRRRSSTAAQRKQQNRMRKAAKTCKGLKGQKFKSCMRRELKK